MSHIVVAGPIAGDDVRAYLAPSSAALPPGYGGAPLTGVLIGELLAMGHRVTAITTDSSLAIDAEPARRDGAGFQFVVCPARLRAWRFNGRHPGRALDFFALERRGIEQEIRRAAPDLVHVHWSYEFALAALNTPFPHLITCHDSPAAVLKFTRSPYRALRYLMAMRVFRAGVHFTTVSKYMQTQLSTVLRKPVAIVPNPVSSQVLSLGRARERPRTRKVAMVCNGWHRLKNPEPGLHAFAAWRQGEPGAELHLFGVDFGWGERAQRWTQARGLDAGVHFHGRMPHVELVETLASMDVLMHCSLEESFGVVIAEALALGLPVVAGMVSGAVPWVVAADAAGASACAVLVDVRRPEALEAGLRTAFDDGYARRSAAGVERARSSFAPRRVAEAYVDHYQALLREGANLSVETVMGSSHA